MIKKFNIYAYSMNPEDGGIQNTAYEFLLFLSLHHDIKGLCSILPDKYKNPNITDKNRINRWSMLFWLISNSNKNTCNIVMNVWDGVPALLNKYIRKSSYFVLAHGNDIYELTKEEKKLKRRAWEKVNKRILREAEFIACNSKYTKKLLSGIIPDDKCYIIHPPCTEYVQLTVDNITWDDRTIFSICRLEERKGLQFVIEAISILKERYPDIKYYIAGDGPYRPKLESIVNRLNLQDNVIMLGRVSNDDKEKYFKKCIAFAMPSIDLPEQFSVEGFGIVFIEANQFGKYVIAGNSGGMPDAVKNNVTGSILKSVTPSCIAESIADIIQNTQKYYSREKMQDRLDWAKKHTSENIIKQYIDVMKERNLLA